jgi:hypothetical protein
MAHAASDAVITAQIRVLADEVANIRRRANERWRPWYRDLAVIVALMAFIFSVATTVFSYIQANEQRLHDNRAELRNLTQRLSALPAEYVEVSSRYDTSNPAHRTILGQLSRQYNTELQLLARQAVEVIARLPDGQVSSTEYGAVGAALQLGGLLEQGRQLIRRAVLTARDTSDEVIALQLYGQSLFYAGDFAQGREQFRTVLQEVDKDPAMTPDQKLNLKTQALLLWMEAEMSQGLCAQAQERMRDAQEQVGKSTNPVLSASLASNLAAFQAQLDTCGTSNTRLLPPLTLPTPITR